MNIDQKQLIRFERAVINQAKSQRDKEISALKKEAEEYKDVSKNKAIDVAYNYIQSNVSNIKIQTGKTISKKLTEAKSELLEKRLSIKNDIMSQLKEKLIAFVNSDSYSDYIICQIKKCQDISLSDDLDIFVKENQTVENDILKNAFDNAKILSTDIKIGGFIIKDNKNNILLDCTLDKKLKEADEKFLSVADLYVEI